MATTFDLGVRPLFPTVLSDGAAALGAGWREWRRLRGERAAHLALARLDARLIRDMGLDPDRVRATSGEPLPFGLKVLISKGRFL